MAATSFRLPDNTRSYQDTVRWLIQDQFPSILSTSIKMFEVLPKVGIYKHFNPTIQPFDQALHNNLSRDHTISGVGSLFDYEKFGHIIKRPQPQQAGTSCYANSLCLEPTCFGFTEGVNENNNVLQDMCWSLSMPCLKDMFYSDKKFEDKMNMYFSMFFKQPSAVIQAYQRTRLIKEAIKVVATNKNIRYTGTLVGTSEGISVPFYVDPADPYSFPVMSSLPSGAAMSGVNLDAFMMFLAPRLFAGAFSGGQHGFKVYGLTQDYKIAKVQTASVSDQGLSVETLMALANKGVAPGMDPFGENFTPDGLFPTFKTNVDTTRLEPVAADILEPAAIYGFVQTVNPSHNMQEIRGLLLVPDNWNFNLVEPPKDDFSDLGLGQGLNFRMNTPGVFPVVMSSSMFTGRAAGVDGTVILGGELGEDGMMRDTVRGLEDRQRQIAEAVRTEIMMTYSSASINNAASGQYPLVGRPTVTQKRADGFELKSTMYVSSDVHGTARPVLILFKTDMPRSARPIAACNTVDVSVTGTVADEIASVCPGGQTFAIVTFNNSQAANFAAGNTAVYRSGPRAATYNVTIDVVTGQVIQLHATDNTSLLPACAGPADDYGILATLEKVTGSTNVTSKILKGIWDVGSSRLFIETLHVMKATSTNATGTIKLADGTSILVKTAANATGVFLQVVDQVGETCDLSTMNCNCLAGATLVLD